MLSVIDKFGKTSCKKLLIVMLITDGCYCLKQSKYPKFAYCGNDKILHEVFINLMKRAYGVEPSYRQKDQTMYQKLEYIEIYKDLIKYCKDLNKKSDTITLDFLKNENRKVQQYALRLAMSAEGSISISRNDKGSLRGNLMFACANPRLCQLWADIFSNHGIKMQIRKNKYVYSGVSGIQTVKASNILNFIRIGGFVPSVKVQKGTKFKGFDKNDVLNIYQAFWGDIKKGRLAMYTKWSKAAFESKTMDYCRGSQTSGYLSGG